MLSLDRCILCIARRRSIAKLARRQFSTLKSPDRSWKTYSASKALVHSDRLPLARFNSSQAAFAHEDDTNLRDDVAAPQSLTASTTEGTIEPVLPSWSSYEDRLDPLILQTMRETFKYTRVSKVQQDILDMMPIQNDLLVRSKTGTGKTLAFLVPALQRAFDDFSRRGLEGSQLKTYANRNASTLIISPTRELAGQIATEARRLVTTKGSNMKALLLVGGDSKREQLKLMRRERNDFVVGTPGRLLDMFRSVPDFASLMPNLQTLILDEADTLLELGFRSDLEEMLQFIPQTRQTYMFSATVSKDVRQIARSYLSRDHVFLNTVGKDEQDSHMLIEQEYILRPSKEHVRVVLSLLISEMLKNTRAKVMVFLPTTRMTLLYASMFKTLRRLYPEPTIQQFDIHAQRTQDSRSKVSSAFRTANTGAVLFTTDVSARGVDYPDVSLVIQVGAPRTRDMYIHRIGRTGRAGKAGHNVLVVSEYEKEFLHDLERSLPIKQKAFPDSEIELGAPQAKVFSLMKRSTSLDLLRDTYSAHAASSFPRIREFRTRQEAILADLEAWWKDLAGEGEPVPELSPRLLQSGGGRGRRDPHRSSNPYARDRLRPGEREWRPTRPSEGFHGMKSKHHATNSYPRRSSSEAWSSQQVSRSQSDRPVYSGSRSHSGIDSRSGRSRRY